MSLTMNLMIINSFIIEIYVKYSGAVNLVFLLLLWYTIHRLNFKKYGGKVCHRNMTGNMI